MAKEITTSVMLVSVNTISDEEEKEVLASNPEYDSIEDLAASMEDSVAAIMARQFRDADDVPILDVTTYVADEGEGGAPPRPDGWTMLEDQ